MEFLSGALWKSRKVVCEAFGDACRRVAVRTKGLRRMKAISAMLYTASVCSDVKFFRPEADGDRRMSGVKWSYGREAQIT